jgi:YHS domain-containing protein
MANPVDPVCGMELSPGQVEAQSRYKGKAYSFCSQECKREFDKNPEKYASTADSADKQPPTTSA